MDWETKRVVTREEVDKKSFRKVTAITSDIALFNYDNEADLRTDLDFSIAYNKKVNHNQEFFTICKDWSKLRKLMAVIVDYNIVFDPKHTTEFLKLEKLKEEFKKLKVFDGIGT